MDSITHKRHKRQELFLIGLDKRRQITLSDSQDFSEIKKALVKAFFDLGVS